MADSLVTLKEGTLYPLLHGLESDGMIEAYWEDTELARKRKYYRITKKGLKLLDEKKVEWLAYSRGVGKIIGGSSL